jgi:CheY-like chemotaxis protein
MAKILLVEDEPDNRDLIRMFLESNGHEIATAATGEDAVAEATHAEFDLVLMDLSLPGEFDGIEATRRLRADAKFDRVPVVALTAHAMRGDRARALAAGCDEHIAKPIVDLREFAAEVARLVARGRAAGVADQNEAGAGE